MLPEHLLQVVLPKNELMQLVEEFVNFVQLSLEKSTRVKVDTMSVTQSDDGCQLTLAFVMTVPAITNLEAAKGVH